MSIQQNSFQGRRVVIESTSNPFAQAHVGKAGTVVGHAPLDMVIVDLDDGTTGYWAHTYNLRGL
jgi:hypothetical protein